MKHTRRIPALLLAVAMLFSLSLAGCKKEAPIAGDQVAVALFDLILKDDASAAVELFGYADEAEARADWGMEEGSLYTELADELTAQFSSAGYTVSSEDMQKFIDAFVAMFSEVKLTAKVKESDEKAGTAVVTCTINTFDPEALTQAMNDAMSGLDPNVFASQDMEEAFGALLSAMADGISGIKPTDKTADFDVDFELSDMEVNGKAKKVWVPQDSNKFGELISTTALGG